MFRPLLFLLMCFPSLIWHSWRMLQLDPENDPLDKLDGPPRRWAESWLRLAGVKYEADLSTIEPGGHYVFMGNHSSYMDIPVLFSALLDHHIRFVAKKSLFDIPIYGKALAHSKNISMDRENRRSAMKSLAEAVEVAKSGISPLIFPEGTRNPDPSDLMEFKTGGMILALKSGLPVVPVVMINAAKVLPKDTMWVRNQHVIKLKTLPVIHPDQYTLKERNKFRDDLRAMMRKAYFEMLAEEEGKA